MKHAVFAVVAVICGTGLATGAAVAQPARTWTCTAPNLVNFSYDGGDQAYIHLATYTSGGTYAVTKNKAGTQATGVTANGTKFVCTAK